MIGKKCPTNPLLAHLFFEKTWEKPLLFWPFFENKPLFLALFFQKTREKPLLFSGKRGFSNVNKRKSGETSFKRGFLPFLAFFLVFNPKKGVRNLMKTEKTQKNPKKPKKTPFFHFFVQILRFWPLSLILWNFALYCQIIQKT
jgi:hypothetical protein